MDMKSSYIIAVFFVVFSISLWKIGFFSKFLTQNNPSTPSEEVVKPEIKEEIANFVPKNYQDAIAMAKKLDKKVLLMLSSESCEPCHRMINTTLKDNEIKKIIDEQYILFIVEDDAELQRKFMALATPAYRVITSDGRVVKKGIGFMDVRKFKSFLTTL